MNNISSGNMQAFTHVKDAVDTAAETDAKLRAGADGTLVARPGKGGMLVRLRNAWSGRDQVRRTVKEGLKEVRRAADGTSRVESAIAAARKEISRTGHDARAAVLAKHFGAASEALGISDHAITLQAARKRGIVKEPRLSDLPGFAASDHGVGAAIRTASIVRDVDGPARLLGAQLREALKAAEESTPGLHLSCVTCRCVALRDELVQQLRAGMTLPPGKAYLRKVVDRAVQFALEGAHERDCEFDRTGSVVNVKSFELKGKRFDLVDRFEGGYGSVGVYKESGNPDAKPMVLKWVRADQEDRSKSFEEMSSEALIQAAATLGGPGQVVGLEGAMRLRDGGIALLMEYAELGTAHRVTQQGEYGLVPGLHRLDPECKDESLERVRRTIIADLLDQDTAMLGADVCHLDKKFANIVITGEGKLKVMDWGTGALSTKRVFRLDDSDEIIRRTDNPRWRDAAVARAYKKLKDLSLEIYHSRQKNLSKINKLADDGDLSKTEAERQRREVLVKERDEKRLLKIAVAGHSADAWSTGVSIYELYVGHPPFTKDAQGKTRWDSEILEAHDKFMDIDSVDGRRAALFPDGSPVPKDIQDMVLGLMDPDPQIRPGSVALRSKLAGEGIGSQEARDMIVKIAKDESARAAR